MNKTYCYAVEFNNNARGYVVTRREYPIADDKEILTEQALRPWVCMPEVLPSNYVYGTPRGAAMALARWVEGGSEGGTTDEQTS